MFKLTPFLWACLAVGVLWLTAPAHGVLNNVLLARGGSKFSSTGPKVDVAFSESDLSAGNQATSAGVEPVLEPRRRALLADTPAKAATRRPPSPPRPPPSPRRPPVPRPPPKIRQPKPPLPSPLLSPSPPPPPPSSVSRVCAALTLISPTDASGAPTYTFGKQVNCSELAKFMITNLTDAATAVGAALSVPFTQEECSAAYAPTARPPLVPHILVCGSFLNDVSAAKLQTASANLQAAITNWQRFALGLEINGNNRFCPPPGFKLTSWILSDVPGLVGYYTEASCDRGRFTPSLPSSSP